MPAGDLLTARLDVAQPRPRAVTADGPEQIDAWINGWSNEAQSLEIQEMAIEQAKATAGVAMFAEKYADVERVTQLTEELRVTQQGLVAVQGLEDQLGGGAPAVLGGLHDSADLAKVILEAAFGQAVIVARPRPESSSVGRPKLAAP